MSNVLDSHTVNRLQNFAIDALSQSNKAGRYVDEIVSNNNYNNPDFDGFLNVLYDAFEHYDLVAESRGEPSVKDPSMFNEAAGSALAMAIGCFSVASDYVWSRLSNDQQIQAESWNAMYATALEELRTGVIHPRNSNVGHRGARQPSNNFRNNNNQGNYRNPNQRQPYGRNEGMLPPRVDLGYNTSPARAVSQSHKPTSSTTQYAIPARANQPLNDTQPARRTVDTPSTRRPNVAGFRQPVQGRTANTRALNCMADEVTEPKIPTTPKVEKFEFRKSPISQMDTIAELFNPRVDTLYHVKNSNKYVLEVDKKGHDVEKYSAHELGVSPINQSRNGLIIPSVELVEVPPLGDDNNISEEPNIRINEMETIGSRAFELSISSIAHRITTDAAFTITPIRNVVTLPIPTSVLKGSGLEVDGPKTFNAWKSILDNLKSKIQTVERNEVKSVLTSFISVIDKQLAKLTTELLSVVVGVDTYISNFQSDFNECWKFLKEPENAQMYTAWCDSQRAVLTNGLSVSSIEDAKEADSAYSIVSFESLTLHVNMFGEVPQDTIAFSTRRKLATVEYKRVPEFYTACERLISYRNNHYKMANVMISDSFDNHYLVFAGQNGASKITAMFL